MLEFENDAFSRAYSIVAGVDEAGRGPLAGPVVASAVVLPSGCLIEHCDDSKKLTPQLRDDIFQRITSDSSIDYGIGIASHEDIDRINILRATMKAMTDAVMALKTKPDYVLIDGLSIPGLGIDNREIIKGDSKSLSIAAASIVAKVTRDRIMEEYDVEYPGYGFAKHKGYGTKDHQESLRKLGPCPIHRTTFITPKAKQEELRLW